MHHDCRSAEESLDELDRKLTDVSTCSHTSYPLISPATFLSQVNNKLSHMTSSDISRANDVITSTISRVEGQVRTLQSDVQVLREGSYAQADQLQRRVTRVRDRLDAIGGNYKQKLVARMQQRARVNEDAVTAASEATRKAESARATKQAQNSATYKQVESLLDWIKMKHVRVEFVDVVTSLHATCCRWRSTTRASATTSSRRVTRSSITSRCTRRCSPNAHKWNSASLKR